MLRKGNIVGMAEVRGKGRERERQRKKRRKEDRNEERRGREGGRESKREKPQPCEVAEGMHTVLLHPHPHFHLGRDGCLIRIQEPSDPWSVT